MRPITSNENDALLKLIEKFGIGNEIKLIDLLPAIAKCFTAYQLRESDKKRILRVYVDAKLLKRVEKREPPVYILTGEKAKVGTVYEAVRSRARQWP